RRDRRSNPSEACGGCPSNRLIHSPDRVEKECTHQAPPLPYRVAMAALASSCVSLGAVSLAVQPSREQRQPYRRLPVTRADASPEGNQASTSTDTPPAPAGSSESRVSGDACKACGRTERVGGCNGEGRIQGGVGALPGFQWFPVKVYRPCPAFVEAGGKYKRLGQSLDEMAFGTKADGDDKDISERLKG
ncbi:unnamed protein product, partial [Closterium sp. NIES-54]